MSTKKTLLLSFFGIALAAGIYGYKEYNRKPKNLAYVKANVEMTTSTLIGSFEANEQEANEKYLDKIIAVKGRVKAVEKNDNGFYTVILGDENNMSSVRCSMDSLQNENVASIVAGSHVTMKGACTGFNADELLGSDVILNRCVLEK